MVMQFSFPSIIKMWEKAVSTFSRFPLAIISSILATSAAIWLVNKEGATELMEARMVSISFVSFLGISWFYGITVFLEQQARPIAVKIGTHLLAVAILLLYYFYLGTNLMSGPNEMWYQLALFFLLSHLIAAFAPFFGSQSVDSFWEYNKALFLRILLSVIYSGVLFIGLSIAIIALDILLGFDVDEQAYMTLFFLMGGIFNTWFFLAGVPGKHEISGSKIDYPKGLRVFVQFVLIPLVTAYIVILYAYLFKIIIQWELPNGWVANLVLSFSIAGILSLLLLYPLQENEDKRWIQLYAKWYYRALIPLVGLLLFSIWVRISDYGVTINRYFVATLGVWLTLLVIYFIFSKKKNIQFIPISMAAFVLFSAAGPLNAFNVAERSQLGRILEFTQSEAVLSTADQIESISLAENDLQQINSSIQYLVENHGRESLLKIMDEERATILEDSLESNPTLSSQFITEDILGIPWRSIRYDFLDEDGIQNFSYSSYEESPLNIGEYEYDLGEYQFNESTDSLSIVVDDQSYALAFNFESHEFSIEKDESFLIIPIDSLIQTLHSSNDSNWYKSGFSQEELTLAAQEGGLKVLMIIQSISGGTGAEEKVHSARVRFLVGE